MSNNIIEKYLFCENRISLIRRVFNESYSYNYDLKEPKNLVFNLALITGFVLLNAIIGLYLISEIIVLNTDVKEFQILMIFVMIAIGYVINYCTLKLLDKFEIINKKRELKNIKTQKRTPKQISKDKEDSIKVYAVFFAFALFPVSLLIYFFIGAYLLLSYTSEYKKLKQNIRQYAKNVYLKRYSSIRKLKEKREKYKKAIINNEECIHFLYKNKDNKKYSELYRYIVNELKKEEEDVNILNKKLNKKIRNPKTIKIETY